jgi:hypothetical protein
MKMGSIDKRMQLLSTSTVMMGTEHVSISKILVFGGIFMQLVTQQ